MQLSKAINSLLYNNDCVTVPGFGSFIVNKFSSVYDEKKGKFYPPSRRVSFNPKIKNNDGLLAKFISEKDILIIAPFNVQVNYLKRKLNKKLKIGTVDNFQGQEALISIFSLTSSSGEDAPRGLDFLLEPNRLNVAISRAKILSIIVGSPSLAKSFCKKSEEVEKLNRLIRLMRTGNS